MKVMKCIVICLFFSLGNMVFAKQDTRVIGLDKLDIGKCKSDYHSAKTNQSASDKPLTIAGKQFEKGIGVSAPSQFRIKLAKGSKRFTACVGVDDSIPKEYTEPTNLKFSIVADKGRVLWDSNTIKLGQSVNVDIDLTGVEEIELIVETSFPHSAFADWADAKFEVCGEAPKAIAIKTYKPYILTPKQPDAPRINGADIFGVRPNNPVLYRIAATGKRPMKFSVVGLPEGLNLDNQTGIITGKINKAGNYTMTFTAENGLGKANKDFTIAVGETICLTPPMGWDSWNCWGCSVDAEKIKVAADAMVKSGLADHGWQYINIDDCWHGKRDPNTGKITSNEKFPDMKALADYVHSLGLKIGLYTDCGPKTCAGYEGSQGYEQIDIDTYAEWGFDYVKIDWCYCEGKDQQQTYSNLGQIIPKAKRDIVFSICEWGNGKPWLWGEKAGGNCWRTTGDIFDTWQSILNIGFSQGNLWQYAGPGHWNDPDMMVVGKVGWGPSLRQTRLTPDEQYTHVSLWCLLASPLLIGGDMNSLDDFTFSLLSNDEVIAVSQDLLGRQARQLWQGDEQVWVKDMQDGSKAVGLFNLAAAEKNVSFSLADIGLSGKCKVRDLWRQKNIGTMQKEFTAKVPAHGVVLIRIIPKD
ncbi:MAG: NPCBM/NEW2 domain-containing protein [Planctomycetaceae bacterium]|nr:NPCBM/NEW2 domain-containing protein [Planctomycetaceae bacterium]